tara:strand:- start:250 stop:459 length:210 start_codon:yes stop_codon:yes gene_type:complete
LISSFSPKALDQLLASLPMKNSSEKIQKLRRTAEASLNKTAQLQQALAQLEATLSRKEEQKVTEKSQKP